MELSEKEKIKITEMCVPTNGELYSSDTACSGDIVILPNDVLQLNSILGNKYCCRRENLLKILSLCSKQRLQ